RSTYLLMTSPPSVTPSSVSTMSCSRSLAATSAVTSAPASSSPPPRKPTQHTYSPILPTDSILQHRRRLPDQILAHMLVHLQRDRRAAVPQHLAHHLGVDVRLQ